MAEGVLDPFHDTGDLLHFALGDAGAPHRQIDDLRDGEESYHHGAETQAIPEIERAQRVTQGTGLWIDADGRQQEADAATQESLGE